MRREPCVQSLEDRALVWDCRWCGQAWVSAVHVRGAGGAWTDGINVLCLHSLLCRVGRRLAPVSWRCCKALSHQDASGTGPGPQ